MAESLVEIPVFHRLFWAAYNKFPSTKMFAALEVPEYGVLIRSAEARCKAPTSFAKPMRGNTYCETEIDRAFAPTVARCQNT